MENADELPREESDPVVDVAELASVHRLADVPKPSSVDCAIAGVASDEPSSITITSKGACVWPRIESRVSRKKTSPFKTGTMTDTRDRGDCGGREASSPRARSCGGSCPEDPVP